MSEEVKEQDEGLTFLGLNEAQFGTVVYVSSAGQQISDHLGNEVIRKEMERIIEESSERGQEELINWVRMNRNYVLRMNSISSLALTLLAQVEDMCVNELLEKPANSTEETK